MLLGRLFVGTGMGLGPPIAALYVTEVRGPLNLSRRCWRVFFHYLKGVVLSHPIFPMFIVGRFHLLLLGVLMEA